MYDNITKRARIGFLRLIFCFVFLLGILIVDAMACSEVFIDKGGKVKVSARNFDFMSGNGFVRYSPAGTDRLAQYVPQDSHPLKWTSKYASVTFNASFNKTKSPADDVYKAGVDGINQAGLKIGTYFLGSSVFPKDGVKITLDIASLLQYLLDNFKSVDEALADLAGDRYRITSTPTESVEIKLHLFLHDVTGASAIVEFIDGKIKVTRNPEIPVLANDIYSKSLEHLKLYNGFGGELAIPGAIESLDRFVRGVYYWNNLPVPADSIQATNYGFAAIQLLTVPPGFTHGGTHWTIVTDIVGRRIYFRTANNPAIAIIDLNKLSASGKASSDIDLLQTDMSGDVSDMFKKINAFKPTVTTIAPVN
jgi:penicillin V acylase-like amidase (Ntn superfamily)